MSRDDLTRWIVSRTSLLVVGALLVYFGYLIIRLDTQRDDPEYYFEEHKTKLSEFASEVMVGSIKPNADGHFSNKLLPNPDWTESRMITATDKYIVIHDTGRGINDVRYYLVFCKQGSKTIQLSDFQKDKTRSANSKLRLLNESWVYISSPW